MTPYIKVGLSEAFHNKEHVNQRIAKNHFPTAEVTVEALSQHILSGKAWTPSFYKNDIRRTENFEGSQVLVLDLDNNVSVAEAQRHPFVGQYAAVIHSSARSTREYYKTRAIFILDQIVPTSHMRKSLQLGLIEAAADLNPDRSCEDSARQFFGSTNRCEDPYINPEAVLPLAVVAEFTRPQAETDYERHRKRQEAAVNRSRQRNTRSNNPKRQARQQHYAEATYQRITAEYLAVPGGKGLRHRAFVTMAMALIARQKGGWPGFDSVEADIAQIGQQTERTEREINDVLQWAYNIADAFPLNLPPDLPRQSKSKSESRSLRQRIKPFDLPPFTPTHRAKEAYISNIKLGTFQDYGAIIIKSATGTGKTELGQRLIEAWTRQYDRKPRVLVISHRRSLLKALAKRLGCVPHDSLDLKSIQELCLSAPQLGITYDSLWRIAEQTYDIIIIDEIEQVLQHTFGGTMTGRMPITNHETLVQLIGNAGQVFAFDATATDIASDWLRAAKPGVPFMALENIYPIDKGEITLYLDKTGLYQRIVVTIEEKQGVVVIACATKRESQLLYAYLVKRYGANAGFLLNADNSDTAEARYFLEHIDQELPKLRFFVYSPSIGTGVDIQAPVRAVFGVFHNMPLNPEDHLQMLARCRNTLERGAWVQSCTTEDPVDVATIANPHEQAANITAQLANFTRQPDPNLARLNHLEAQFEAKRNLYRHDHMSAFHALAKKDGFQTIHCDDHVVQHIKFELADIYQALQAHEKQETLTQTPVSAVAFENHRRNGTLTPEMNFGLLRWKIENLVGKPIDGQLYDDLRTAKKRRSVHRLADALDDEQILAEADRFEEENRHLLSKRKHQVAITHLFKNILKAIFGCELADLPAVFTQIPAEILAAQAEVVFQHYRQALIAYLGWREGHNSEDPIAMLRWFLNQYGLKMLRDQKMEKRVRFMVYSLDVTTFYKWLGYAQAQLQQRRLKALAEDNDGLTTNWQSTRLSNRSNTHRSGYSQTGADSTQGPKTG